MRDETRFTHFVLMILDCKKPTWKNCDQTWTDSVAFSVNQSELDHLQTLYKSSVRSKRSFFKHRSRLFSGRRSNKIGTSAAADTDNSVTSQGSAASSNGPGKILPAITLDPSRLHPSNHSENIEDISMLKTKLSDNVFQVPPPGKSIDVSSRKKMAPKFDGGEFIELQEKLQKLTNASKTSHETFASGFTKQVGFYRFVA